MKEELLLVEDLKMHYTAEAGSVKAIDGVSFSLKKGESLGIAGESGSGKSSIAITVLRVLPENGRILGGKIVFQGQDLLAMPREEFRKKVRWKRISIVFQGAMNALTPVIKVGDQISEAILTHEDTTKESAFDRTAKLLSMVGIDPSRADSYPFEMSGGMKQRATIAMALANNPELLIADEPTTALDVIVQAQIIELLKKLQKELNLSLIVISHDLSIIAQLCTSVGIMYAGRMVELSDSKSFFKDSLHPYSSALLSAFPSLFGSKKRLESIVGVPPNLLSPPSGCRFHPRCPKVFAPCSTIEPRRTSVGERQVECHLHG